MKLNRREIDEKINKLLEEKKTSFKKVLSTGSTLLDLAISGKRVHGGGMPGGILVEVFGPSGSGKTAILAETSAYAQSRGGEVMFLDPEARLDAEYSKIYGMNISEENYYRPNTVREVFDLIWKWKPEKKDSINVVAVDSLAALTTEWELEDKDEYGMRRAKEFSEGLRKTCRLIANNNWLIMCSNQIRQGKMGETVPGGKSIAFYSTVRIQIKLKDKIVKTKTINGKEFKKVIGIESECFVMKNTLDDPFRKATIYIVFGYGIDDIRGNLQWLKEVTKSDKYDCIDKEYSRIDDAIKYIEENELEEKLKERVVKLWEEIEKKFISNRKRKKRF